MKKILGFLWKRSKKIIALLLLIGIGWGTWLLGRHFDWDWGGFWSNFISNAGSSAVIGFVLYWIITRPDEKKATDQRRAQALSMLRIEFKTNLQRATQYGEALKTPENDLTPFYPLRFTRGAWNSLRESGFLPQFDDVSFVYELLRVNEIIMVANSSFSTIRKAKSDNKKLKLKKYANKAVKECEQIEEYLKSILVKLGKMDLPEIILPEYLEDEDILDDDDTD